MFWQRGPLIFKRLCIFHFLPPPSKKGTLQAYKNGIMIMMLILT